MPLDNIETSLWDIDCDDVSREVATELLRQAEMRQEAEFRAALGMDQRAAVLAAAFVAVGGAAAAAGLTLTTHDQLRVAALAAAILLGFASALCGWTCRPQGFRFPGVEPLDWGADPKYLKKPLPELLMARIAEIQDHVTDNRKQQTNNGRVLTAGMLIAAATPAVAWIFSWALSSV